MRDVIGPGSLKLVIGCSSHRSLRDLIHGALRDRSGANDIRVLDGETLIVYTNEQPSALRDLLQPVLAADETLLVVEFDRWSSYGPTIDSRWLLRRGH